MEDRKEVATSKELNVLHSREYQRLQQLEMLIQILKDSKQGDFGTSSFENLENAVTALQIDDFVKLGKSDYFLGLQGLKDIQLSYTETRAVRQYVSKKIIDVCHPVIKFISKVKREYPILFDLNSRQKELVTLENKRGNLLKNLIELKNRRCELLKKCLEYRVECSDNNSFEILSTQYKYDSIKAKFLNTIFAGEISSRTSFTTKAIKEVEQYIDQTGKF